MRVFPGWPSWKDAHDALTPRVSRVALNRLDTAYRFAAGRHAGQTRPAGEPYVQHLLEVVQVLALGAGENDDNLLIAALLHDVVEDTATSLDEVATLFGPRVAELVGWVTQPSGSGTDRAEARRTYLRHLRDAPTAAVMVKLADRLSNVQRLDTHPRPDRQRAYYRETCEHILPLTSGLPWFTDWFVQWRVRYRYLDEDP